MSSALDVMQAMGSSIWSLLSKVRPFLINPFSKFYQLDITLKRARALQVEEMNKMVSELAVVVTKESSMQGKCEDLLASTAIMQVKKQSSN